MKYSDYGKIIGWVALSVGALLLITSFFLPESNTRIQSIFLGLGIALFPAGFFIILNDINYSTRTKIQIEKTLFATTDKLSNSIDVVTDTLSNSIDGLKTAIDFLEKSNELGIAMGYKNREEGLVNFLEHLERYVSNPVIKNKSFVFVGSSLKGLLDTKDYGERISQIISDAYSSEDTTEFN